MVSRRNFITITLIMLVLLFMFQTPEVIKDRMNDYDTNQYAESTGSSFTDKDREESVVSEWSASRDYIVYIGNVNDKSTGSMVWQWCAYSKRYLDVYSSILKYSLNKEQKPDAVVVDCKYFDTEKGTKKLENLAGNGVNIIFCNLPNLRKLKGNMPLRELLGIRAILFDRVHVKGIHLQEGLLLGGEKIYMLDDKMERSMQDLNLAMPWFQAASSAKVYMTGILDDNADFGNLPAVIWRNSVGKAKIFAVNGNYMSSNTGLGLLEGMLYETKQYALYPVVNAQTLAVLNYPCLASENEEEMMRRYSRPLNAVYRDLVWPGLVATTEKSRKKMTCFLTTQQDYTDANEPQGSQLAYYLALLQERKAEAGLSASVQKGKGLEYQLKFEEECLGKAVPGYVYVSLYQARLDDNEMEQALKSGLYKNVRTILADYDSHGMLLSYFQHGDVTRQLAVNDGYSHTFSEDLRQNSIETALGYSSIVVDLNRVAFPGAAKYSWEKLYDRFASYTTTYWNSYEKLKAATMAESDERIRRFLSLDFTQKRIGNEITVRLTNFEKEAYFILRLQQGNEFVEKAQGASFEQMDDKSYLVTATRDHVVLSIGKKGSVNIAD